MVEQNFDATTDGKSNEAKGDKAALIKLQDDSKTGKPADLHLAQSTEDLPGGQLPPGFEEFFGEFLKNLQEQGESSDVAGERPERNSDAMRKFDKTQDNINAAMLEVFRNNQPALREAIGETDQNLLDKANAYVLESYESGRLDRLSNGRDELSRGVLDIQAELKKIPLWEDQVDTIEQLNGVFAPDTDPETRKVLLGQIGEDHPEIAKKAEALVSVQDRLKPDVEEDLKRRNVVHQALEESQEARMTYYQMLSQMTQHPSVKVNEARVMADEMRAVQSAGTKQESDFGRYSYQPDIKNFGLKFPTPKEPRRQSA